MSNVAGDSTQFLNANHSDLEVALPVPTTSDDVVKLFADRGVALVDSTPVAPAGTRRLHLARGGYVQGNGGVVAVAANYFVTVSPTQAGSSVAIVGATSINGQLACTPAIAPFAPCVPSLDVPPDWTPAADGEVEASVINGVMQELGLDAAAKTGGPNPADGVAARDAISHDNCLAARATALSDAQKIADLDARGKALMAAPTCD